MAYPEKIAKEFWVSSATGIKHNLPALTMEPGIPFYSTLSQENLPARWMKL